MENANMNKGTPITLRVNPVLKERLKKIADSEDRSVSATIRRAIREYVETREVPEITLNESEIINRI